MSLFRLAENRPACWTDEGDKESNFSGPPVGGSRIPYSLLYGSLYPKKLRFLFSGKS